MNQPTFHEIVQEMQIYYSIFYLAQKKMRRKGCGTRPTLVRLRTLKIPDSDDKIDSLGQNIILFSKNPNRHLFNLIGKPDNIQTIPNIFWTGKSPSRHLFYPILKPDYVWTTLNIFWTGKTSSRHLIYPIGMPDYVRTICNIFYNGKSPSRHLFCLICMPDYVRIIWNIFWIGKPWFPKLLAILPNWHARSCPNHLEISLHW